MREHETIVFFDGYCNLCNGSVDFIIRNEKEDQLKFASLQSAFAQSIMKKLNVNSIGDSVIVYSNGKLLEYSDAALFISKYLKFPYSLFQYTSLIPRFIRDAVYKFIAKNRYRWFGKKDSCRMPTEAERNKFLS